MNGMTVLVPQDLASTLGNKNFFSEVLVLFLPFLIIGFLGDNRKWKILFLFALLLDLAFIALLQTTSAWIAISISIVLFIIFSVKFQISLSPIRIPKKVKIIVGSCFFVLLVSGFIVFKNTRVYNDLFYKASRVKEYFTNPELLTETRNENNNSVFERLVIWRNSMEMIKDHPVLGAGLNNWKLFNPAYGMGGTQFINGGYFTYEHPHNDYLLIWAEQGPVGILLYLALFFIVIRIGIRKLRSGDVRSRRQMLLLICGVVSFMILSLFAYPRSRFYSMILLMILMAMIVSSDEEEKSVFQISLKGLMPAVAFISIFGMIASYNRIVGEIHTKNAIYSQLNKNFSRMYREADKANNWYFPLDIMNTPLDWYKGMALFYSGNVAGAMAEYEKAILVNPNHTRLLNDIATTYEQSGRRPEAIVYYRKVIGIIPLFTEARLNLSAAYFNEGQIDSAFLTIQKVYDLPKRYDEKVSYDNFLSAILYAKTFNIFTETKDSTLIKKLPAMQADKTTLTAIYNESMKKKIPFENYIIDYYKPAEK